MKENSWSDQSFARCTKEEQELVPLGELENSSYIQVSNQNKSISDYIETTASKNVNTAFYYRTMKENSWSDQSFARCTKGTGISSPRGLKIVLIYKSSK